MNDFKTDANGGIPYVFDDYRWEHDADKRAFFALVNGLAKEEDVVIIQGVEITGTGTTQNVSEGYVLIEGEVVQVDAHTTTNLDAGIDYRHILITESFDAAGLKNLEDGGTADTYRKRRATIEGESGTIQAGEIAFGTNVKTLGDLIGGMSGNWEFATPTENIDADISSLSGTFRTKQVGQVCFAQWNLTIALSSETASLSFQAPMNRAPQENTTLGIYSVEGGNGRQLVYVEINSAKLLSLVTHDGALMSTSGNTTFKGTAVFRIGEN